MIDVTRDQEGLIQAVQELLEEEFAFSRVRRIFDAAEGEEREHALRSLPPRLLSPGYYRWAAYLLWLEQRTEFLSRLDAAEMEGLVAVKRARGQWESQHPACPCGARQESRFQSHCMSCGLTFHKREAA